MAWGRAFVFLGSLLTAGLLLWSPPSQASAPACSDGAQGNAWPSYRGSEDHTGCAVQGIQPPLSLVWTFSPGGEPALKTSVYMGSSPAVTDGRVFAGSGEGYLYALDARSGALD